MAVIGALVGPGNIRDEVVRQVARAGEVRLCATAASAVDDAASGRLSLLVTSLRDERGASIARTVIALAARAPQASLIVYDRITRASTGLLLAALAPGLRVDCVVRPLEPLAPVVQRFFASPLPPLIAPLLVHRLVHLAPAPLWPFIAIAALKAPSHRGLDQLARWSGVTPRTVERRLRRAGWAPARVLLQTCRALDVLWLMAEYGWTVRRVQRARGYAFPSAITRLTRRYAGVMPGEVREGIDMRAVVDAAVGRVSGSGSG